MQRSTIGLSVRLLGATIMIGRGGRLAQPAPAQVDGGAGADDPLDGQAELA